MNMEKKFSITEFFKRGGGTYISCLLSLIILPIHVDFLPPVMILWILFWISENFVGFKNIFKTDSPAFMLFAGFALYFIWFVAGLFYTNDYHNGTLLVFRRLTLIVFPLVLVYPGDYIKRKTKQLLRVFSLSTLLYILFLFVLALVRSVYIKNGNVSFNPHPPEADYNNYFFGTDFSFYQHPTYLSMYVIFSVFIAFESFFDRKQNNYLKAGWVISGIILLISLYFLSSRSGILAAAVLTPVYLIIKFRRFRRGWVAFPVIVILLVILLFSFMKNERIKYYFEDRSSNSFLEKFREDNRIPIWKSAVAVIKHHPILGVGAGDASHELKKEYVNGGYSEMYYNNLNAHNQYLEVLLGMGLVGFLIFISILADIVYLAVKKKNLLYVYFIIIILIYCLFESILNRIAGITFFSLFSFLLLFSNEKNADILKPE
jgi:O-antigen ligase